MAVRNVVYSVPLQSLVYTGVGADYALVGSLSNACFLIRIYNGTTEDVTISYNGVTDNEYLEAGDSLVLNAQTNSQPNTNIANFPSGFSVWVKGTEGDSGKIYFSGYYSPQGI